jgi:hypothetical protein
MADVQQVEATIGQRDASSGAPPFVDSFAKLVAGQKLWMW